MQSYWLKSHKMSKTMILLYYSEAAKYFRFNFVIWNVTADTLQLLWKFGLLKLQWLEHH